MKYPFTFEVICYSKETYNDYKQRGVGFCEDFSDAAKIIERYYGVELIAIKHLELYEDSNLITLPKATYNDVVKCLESEEVFEETYDEKGELSDAEI